MPYELKDLVIDRVDLVDEGANSAAFIELYKRKETVELMDFEQIIGMMKPEHASVIQDAFNAKDAELSKARADLDTANEALTEKDKQLEETNEALAKAKEDLEEVNKALEDKGEEHCTCDGDDDGEGKCSACGKPKKSAAFDETETMKSMPANVRAMFEKMRAQKEAAEEQVRKAAEREAENEAVAKAASLKALPVEQDKLVGILKNCQPEVEELLTTINSAIEATVLEEVGKNKGNGAATNVSNAEDAWGKLEEKADQIAKRDNVTKEKAMATALDENPDLYREYLNGGVK